ncbi:MAG: hypothetical protein D6692_01470 [Planctomycetota bacterium]|nr:MAG: hypothetical protein D6692_01470 [Planctomycetota bacterium]
MAAHLVALILAAASSADVHQTHNTPNTASHILIEFNGWEFHPIRHRASDSLLGFYAKPGDEVKLRPGNVSRLWFESIPDGSWTAHAVNPADLGSLLDHIDLLLGDSIVIETLEFDADDNTAAPPASSPAGPISSGLVQGDATEPIANILRFAHHPAAIAERLAAIGYACPPNLCEVLLDTNNAAVGGELLETLGSLRESVEHPAK